MKIIIITALILMLTTISNARISVVTVPEKDESQITIYNSVDLTLVREKRTLSFKKGMNKIDFSWAGTLIDPTSLFFIVPGKEEEIEVIDVSYPPGVSKSLVWNIKSSLEGEFLCEITYFISGINWSADYIFLADNDEKKAHLRNFVYVNNNSGENMMNAQVRLIVGKINLVEDIKTLAGRSELFAKMDFSDEISEGLMIKKESYRKPRMRRRSKKTFSSFSSAPKKIVKESLSEYYIYTIEGTEDITINRPKRLPNLNQKEVKIKTIYKYDVEHYGKVVKRFFRFENKKKSKLGQSPLPDGTVRVFKRDSKGNIRYVGRNNIKYIPIDEKAEIDLGAEKEIKIERKLMNFVTDNFEYTHKGNISGWDEISEYKIVLTNYRDSQATFEMKEYFDGDWNLDTKQGFKKEDHRTIKFDLILKPGEKKIITYKVTVVKGNRAKK
ncbi:DUF4139 domain-containing protein [bacterium]|nr:DUF4139 domain-containing protein [bacterium]